MKVTIFVESDEARVLSVGFKGNPEFDYGIEVDLPPAELVAFVKALDSWLKAQERLEIIHKAKLKYLNSWRRRHRKLKGQLRKFRQQRLAMTNPSITLTGRNHE